MAVQLMLPSTEFNFRSAPVTKGIFKRGTFRNSGRDLATLRIDGFKTLVRELEQHVKVNFSVNKKKALRRMALFVLRKAVMNAPVKTGHLRGSGWHNVVMENGTPVGYVGFTAKYAAWVHEVNKNYGGGAWKFLLRAMVEHRSELLKIAKEEMSK